MSAAKDTPSNPEIGSDIPPRAAEVEPPANSSVIHAGGSADPIISDAGTPS